MHIYIGADHRGFELKNKVLAYLQSKNIPVTDMGAHEYDANDDFPLFGKAVGKAVQQNPESGFGIVICGSGIGVSIAANRYSGVRCGLIFDLTQVEHGRKNDHINVIALPSDYLSFEQVQKIIDTFLQTEIDPKDKYLRRGKQLDELE